MNSYQAKRIPLAEILGRLGKTPHQERRGELWYLSPFRDETEPSFKINQERNIWYDFGLGRGGNVIDFVREYYHLSDNLTEILRHCETLVGSSALPRSAPKSAKPPAPANESTDALQVTALQPLRNRALIGYLEKRGIPSGIALPWLKEMHYTREGKAYFALAFHNDSGGFELRNPYFKGVHGRKDITLLRCDEAKAETPALVFEGFMDFLSHLVHSGRADPGATVIILNSVAMKNRAVKVIRELGVKEIRLYLDRDESGQALTEAFTRELAEVTVRDSSGLYEGFKDYNAFLIGQRGRS